MTLRDLLQKLTVKTSETLCDLPLDAPVVIDAPTVPGMPQFEEIDVWFAPKRGVVIVVATRKGERAKFSVATCQNG